MDAIRFVQVNHLHADNTHHLDQFRLLRFDDLPEGEDIAIQTARQAARHQAIGDVPPEVERAFFTLAGSMIHDLYGLRLMLGQPDQVVSTEIWQGGACLSTVLAYPGGARSVASWVDLPDLWDFKETLEVYGPDRRVLLSYPTGFARGILSSATIQGIDAEGRSFRQEPAIDWENPFSRELRHFHACIAQGAPCRTSIEAARDDVALIIDIVRAYLDRS
jgi:predicted dehydrogenase